MLGWRLQIMSIEHWRTMPWDTYFTILAQLAIAFLGGLIASAIVTAILKAEKKDEDEK